MSRREPTRGARSRSLPRLVHVEQTSGAGGQTYLYYRRAGRRIPLPQPEGSAAFLLAYEAARREIEKPRPLPTGDTVHAAITAYLASADFRKLAAASQADYRRTLDGFREQFGPQRLDTFGEAELEELRDKYTETPIAWNALRSRMIQVVRDFRRRHPGAMPSNPWETSRRLRPPRSRAHRPWHPDVLLAVLRAATPEFRALLTGYLLTAQRGGDVTRFTPGQYDPAAGTLALTQRKTAEPLVLHVPASLARALETMRGRHPDRLFTTPRGRAWTTGNAQETLARLLAQLGLPRHTLHGLRATGPVALKLLGFENRSIRALTGHTSDQNLETYLEGVDHYPLAKQAQEALEQQFADLLTAAGEFSNSRRFTGTTGRAAAPTSPFSSPLDCKGSEVDEPSAADR